MLAIDIETWGLKPGYTLQPWRAQTKESGIMSIAISDGKNTSVHSHKELFFDVAGMKLTILDTVIVKKENLICGWNIKFDLAFLIANSLKLPPKMQFLDGMLLLKRIMPHLETYALKATLAQFKEHVPSYTGDYSKDIEFKIGLPEDAYTPKELEAMYKYNMQDALYTHELTTYLISISSEAELKQAIRESNAAYLFADSWQRGILVDKPTVEKYNRDLHAQAEELLTKLNQAGITQQIANSPMQLRKYLRDMLHISLTKVTAKGAESVDRHVLKELRYKNDNEKGEIIQTLIDYKNTQNELNKFVASADACAQDTEYSHPEPMLQGTYTGRVTYSIYQTIRGTKTLKNGTMKLTSTKLQIGVPIHQLKRGAMRNMFIAPPGYDLIEFDFSAQEMRLMACVARETTMIGLFNENKDLHSYTAASITQVSFLEFCNWKKTQPEEYSKARFVGKVTNLALQYRLSAQNLYRQWHDVYGLREKTLDDAIIARNTYLSIYSAIPTYWHDVVMTAKHQKFVTNMAGRKYPLTEWYGEEEWKSSQTAINFPIQSSGAEQKILALSCLKNFILENGILFAWDLHDGLYFYIPQSAQQMQFITEVKRILDNLPYKRAWGWQPQVQFPVEAKKGNSWGTLKNVDFA